MEAADEFNKRTSVQWQSEIGRPVLKFKDIGRQGWQNVVPR